MAKYPKISNVQKITSAILLQIFELYWDSGYIWLAPPSSVTTRQCSSELDTALVAPSVGDALIINCVPDDKMSRMANPEGVIYRAGSLTLSLDTLHAETGQKGRVKDPTL